MLQIPNTNIFIGSQFDLPQTNNQEWAFAHVTKKSHQERLGYFKSLPQDDPNDILKMFVK